MRATTVADVMTRQVVTVEPDTPFKDIVDVFVTEGISAVPVVDRAGTVLGIVSEADLLRKEEHLDDEEDARLPALALPHTRTAWRKAAGLTARDVMTAPAVMVTSEAFLPDVARMLARRKLRRLVVVNGGKLVGIVARRDLLRDFQRSDDDIRHEIEQDVFVRTLWADLDTVRATVEHGVVTLTGRLEYQADVDIAVRLVRAMPGVVAVKNRLDYFWNGQADRTGAGPITLTGR